MHGFHNSHGGKEFIFTVEIIIQVNAPLTYRFVVVQSLNGSEIQIGICRSTLKLKKNINENSANTYGEK